MFVLLLLLLPVIVCPSTATKGQLIRRGFIKVRSTAMWSCSFRSLVMVSTLARRCLRKEQRSGLAGLSRHISVRKSPSEIPDMDAHITGRQWILLSDRSVSKHRPAVAQESLRPHMTCLYCYESHSSRWVPLQSGKKPVLERGGILTVISWNINFPNPDTKARTVEILNHLARLCEDGPRHTVIMFQEVCKDSLEAVLENSWVQRFFKLSDVASLESFYTEIAGDSFIMKQLDLQAPHYFTAMMISKDLPVSNAFRVPLVSKQGRDALTVDIPLESLESSDNSDTVRLCTTHLESLDSIEYRRAQLVVISKLLKSDVQMGQNVVAGLVAGDMNSTQKIEHDFPQAEDIQLQDAWQDGPEQAIPILKPFQRDLTNGLARGNTWGYQQENGKKNRTGRRLDKMLYTGLLQCVPLTHGKQLTRGIRRLGVDLKTTVQCYRRDWEVTTLTRRGHLIEKSKTHYFSLEFVERDKPRNGFQVKLDDYVRTSTTFWVSDHYGIMGQFCLKAEKAEDGNHSVGLEEYWIEALARTIVVRQDVAHTWPPHSQSDGLTGGGTTEYNSQKFDPDVGRPA